MRASVEFTMERRQQKARLDQRTRELIGKELRRSYERAACIPLDRFQKLLKLLDVGEHANEMRDELVGHPKRH